MVNKRTETKLTSGSSTYSDTVVNYDGYGSGGLTTISNVVGHDDTNFGGSYTARGNPTSITSGGLTIATMTYDTTGQVLRPTDFRGVESVFSYNDCYLNDGLPPTTYSPSSITNAFPTTITLPTSGSINLCYYWGSGKAATVTDQNGLTTAFHFIDVMDRQTHVMPPLGWTEWSYAANESKIDQYTGIGTTAPTENCTSIGSCRHDTSYPDSFGRFSSSQLVNDPDGATTTAAVTYDSNGRVQTSANPYRSTSDPTYGLETPSYDGLNRVTQVQHADSNIAKLYYGAAVAGVTAANKTQLCATTFGYGYPVLNVDEAGKLKETWTDGFGRVIEVDEPNSAGTLNSNTCYEYYPSNNLQEVTHTTSSGPQDRTYTYDQLSRLVNTYSPETGSIGYVYTNSTGHPCSGNPAAPCSRTDARSIVTTYTYDALDRLVTISYSDGVTPQLTFCHDGANAGCGESNTTTNSIGRLTAMKDGSGETAWSYDTDGRILTEQRTIGTVTKTISYSYNGDGSLSSIIYPSGRKVNYVVGNAERAQSATDAAGTQYAVTASYAAAGPLSNVIYGKVTSGFAGFTATQGFDKRWDLTSILATSSAGTAVNLGYCFYAFASGACPATGSNNNGTVGVITNNKDTGRTETFGYDPLNRILSATTQATSGADCWGQNFTVDALANLYTIQPTQCTVGGLSATVTGITNQLGFNAPPQPTYDLSGNMTYDGNYHYTFDAENHITATSAGSITYVYDGNGMRVEKSGTTLYWRAITGDVLAETDTSGNTKNEYVYFAGRRIAWWDGATPQQNLYYLYPDALGSTRIIAEANGTVCYDSEYTPYGQEINHTSTCPSTYNYRFTGYELDAETGLNYAVARYYSSRLGRFVSPDPIGGSILNPQSLNRYAYVANDPADLTDPLGLYCAVGLPCPHSTNDPSDPWIGDTFYIGQPWFSSWEVFGGPCDPEGCSSYGVSTNYLYNSYGPGGGGGKAPFSVDTRKLADCTLNLYGVVTLSFNSSEPGTTSSVPGTNGSYSGVLIGGAPYSFSSVSVTNDVNTYNIWTLPGNQGNGGSTSAPFTMGFTDPSNPSINYTASGAAMGAMHAVQVIELGNSLALMSGVMSVAEMQARDNEPISDPVDYGGFAPNNNAPGMDLIRCLTGKK